MTSTQSPTRQLLRRRDDRILGGVASGLADYLSVDPVLIRVAFVLLCLFGGSGVVLYAALWLLVPEEGTGDVIARRAATPTSTPGGRGLAFWAGVALIVSGGVTLVARFSFVDPGLTWALVLMGLGVALFRSAMDGTGMNGDDPPPARPTIATEPPATEPPPRGGPTGSGASPEAQRHLGPERSILGRLTLGVMILWIGSAALLDQASHRIAFRGTETIGVALAIVGAGLLVGAFAGRARWLILVGILMTPAVAAASVVDRVEVPFSAGVGPRHYVVDAAVPDLTAELFAGEMVVDVIGDGGDRSVAARMATGRIEVVVPAHLTIHLRARVGAGEIVFDGVPVPGSGQGLRAEVARTYRGAPDAPTAMLDLQAGIGQIEVVRRGSASLRGAES